MALQKAQKLQVAHEKKKQHQKEAIFFFLNFTDVSLVKVCLM